MKGHQGSKYSDSKEAAKPPNIKGSNAYQMYKNQRKLTHQMRKYKIAIGYVKNILRKPVGFVITIRNWC